MVKWGVKVYARLRTRQARARASPTSASPRTKRRGRHYRIKSTDKGSGDASSDVLEWVVPGGTAAGRATDGGSSASAAAAAARRYRATSNTERAAFTFTKVLGEGVTQDEVYAAVGVDVVRGALDGYNGTIFAYGQTGSGKTYTITGGERFADRGIIPRVLSHLWEEFASRKDRTFTCYVSYLQIYNEAAYDLLDRSHTHKPLEEWTRIQLMDDRNGALHLRNLRVYEARTEEDALNLLFLGNVNRVTSETPANQASSRSHCIFTLTVESRGAGADGAADGVASGGAGGAADSRQGAAALAALGDTVRTAKIHLVDLAGSERVGKAAKAAAAALASTSGDVGTAGSAALAHGAQVRREGRHINLSLHYLEQVILALHERSRSAGSRSGKGAVVHVPYRNSMLTSVLRDSLGGNCRTTFIATLHPDAAHLAESLSTCRFAQRCSALSQEVAVNEERDLAVVVARLEAEQAALREQLAEAREGGKANTAASARELTAQDKAECEARVVEFIKAGPSSGEDSASGRVLELPDLVSTLECCAMLKDAVRRAVTAAATARTRAEEALAAVREEEEANAERAAEIERYSTKVAELAAAAERVQAEQAAAAERAGSTTEDEGGASGSPAAQASDTDADAEALARTRPAYPWLKHQASTVGDPAISRSAAAALQGLFRDLAQARAPTAEASALAAAIAANANTPGALSRDIAGDDTATVPRTLGAFGPPLMQILQRLSAADAAPVSADDYKRLLCTGGVFLKHGRRGRPHARLVWVDSMLREVRWRAVGDVVAASSAAAGTGGGRMLVSDIDSVLAGQMTDVFKRKKGAPRREAASFSLLGRDRSLDLEVVWPGAATSNGCSTREIQARDVWVEAFRFLVARARERRASVKLVVPGAVAP